MNLLQGTQFNFEQTVSKLRKLYGILEWGLANNGLQTKSGLQSGFVKKERLNIYLVHYINCLPIFYRCLDVMKEKQKQEGGRGSLERPRKTFVRRSQSTGFTDLAHAVLREFKSEYSVKKATDNSHHVWALGSKRRILMYTYRYKVVGVEFCETIHQHFHGLFFLVI